MYEQQLKENMGELTARLFELYGGRWNFYEIVQRLEKIMRKAADERPADLKQSDEDAVCGENCGLWYQNQDTVGMTLYVDLFAGNLKSLVKKIPYLMELGIKYVHLMPLFDCPKDENDGGYAVSSYRKVRPALGTIEDLRALAEEFRKNEIRLALDFVFNHTSDEHEWAKKAREGDAHYKDFYYIYKDKADADDWNRSLREIFPEARRGSFTHLEKENEWVWTTFHSFQWDLNYSNPEVFLAMCEEMLFIANLGIDVLRLDALAFIWKEKNTTCENLPKAHTLIQAFRLTARIACPALQFKSEAIVHPDEVPRYIGEKECALSYNPLQMALFWSTAATRDTRLLTYSLQRRWAIPPSAAWVNFIRCHDDIGWTFSDEDAAALGINGKSHRKFLNRFFTGQFKGSFAKGEPFQFNPETGDCRVCGTAASLAGLEQAQVLDNALFRKMALSRLKMMYAVLFALPGIPLLYANDEKAVLNDYSYHEDKNKHADSRWLHRIKTYWNVDEQNEAQKEFEHFLRRLIVLRGAEPLFGGSDVYFYDVQSPHVFAFRRGTLHVVANFSETPSTFSTGAWSDESTDLLSGKLYKNHVPLKLDAYQVLWLKERL
ncbi:MAG: alpha-amylase family protein [Treponema sp.]